MHLTKKSNCHLILFSISYDTFFEVDFSIAMKDILLQEMVLTYYILVDSCYILDMSICHFRGVGSILSL